MLASRLHAVPRVRFACKVVCFSAALRWSLITTSLVDNTVKAANNRFPCSLDLLIIHARGRCYSRPLVLTASSTDGVLLFSPLFSMHSFLSPHLPIFRLLSFCLRLPPPPSTTPPPLVLCLDLTSDFNAFSLLPPHPPVPPSLFPWPWPLCFSRVNTVRGRHCFGWSLGHCCLRQVLVDRRVCCTMFPLQHCSSAVNKSPRVDPLLVGNMRRIGGRETGSPSMLLRARSSQMYRNDDDDDDDDDAAELHQLHTIV